MIYKKVIFGVSSGHSNYIYKINEVNVANNWNTLAKTPSLMGGFSFQKEEKIFNWLYKGNTIYDVEIPLDAEIINCYSEDDGLDTYRTNKIILKNPQTINDEIALNLYKISNKDNIVNIKNIVSLVERNFTNTVLFIIDDKITKDNYKELLDAISKLTIFNECKEKSIKKLLELSD